MSQLKRNVLIGLGTTAVLIGGAVFDVWRHRQAPTRWLRTDHLRSSTVGSVLETQRPRAKDTGG